MKTSGVQTFWVEIGSKARKSPRTPCSRVTLAPVTVPTLLRLERSFGVDDLVVDADSEEFGVFLLCFGGGGLFLTEALCLSTAALSANVFSIRVAFFLPEQQQPSPSPKDREGEDMRVVEASACMQMIA